MKVMSLNSLIQFKKLIDDMDIVMSLRSQLERHNITYFESLQEYAKDFCITSELMERKVFTSSSRSS